MDTSRKATYERVVSKETLKPYQEQLRSFLENDGDLNVILLFGEGMQLSAFFSVKLSLVESVRNMLTDNFDSFVLGRVDEGNVLRIPIIFNGSDIGVIVASRYSYIKQHPDEFPQVDLNWF